MKIVEMRVHMDCPGCKSKIKKLALQRVEEGDNHRLGRPEEGVLKTVRKTGRQAELWPYTYNPEYRDFTSRYCNQYHRNPASSFYAVDSYTPYNHHRGRAYSGHDEDDVRCSSYNYYEHGCNGHDHGSAPLDNHI